MPAIARHRPGHSQEFSPGLPCTWQGTKYLSHHLLPPRVIVSRKLDGKRRQDAVPGTPSWDMGVPSGSLTNALQHLPLDVTFSSLIHFDFCRKWQVQGDAVFCIWIAFSQHHWWEPLSFFPGNVLGTFVKDKLVWVCGFISGTYLVLVPVFTSVPCCLGYNSCVVCPEI